MSTDTFGPRRIYVESRHRILADTSPAYRDSLVHPARQRLLAYYAACDPSGTPLALADVESMTLRIRASRDAAEVLVESVVDAADIDVTRRSPNGRRARTRTRSSTSRPRSST
jgi:hypothetical protein